MAIYGDFPMATDTHGLASASEGSGLYILTSDPDDLRALAHAAEIHVELVPV